MGWKPSATVGTTTIASQASASNALFQWTRTAHLITASSVLAGALVTKMSAMLCSNRFQTIAIEDVAIMLA